MTAIEPPTVEDLQEALRELLEALMRHRLARARKHTSSGNRPQLRSVSVWQLMRADRDVLDQRDWVVDPVDLALKEGIRAVGQHLATRLGSTDALRDVAEQLAGRGRRYSQRVSVLDKCFDGIRVGKSDVWLA